MHKLSSSFRYYREKCLTRDCDFSGLSSQNGFCSKCFKHSKRSLSDTSGGRIRSFVRIRATPCRNGDRMVISLPVKSTKIQLDCENNYAEKIKILNLPPIAEYDMIFALKCIDNNIIHKFRSVESDTEIQKIADLIQSSYATFVQLLNDKNSDFKYLNDVEKENVLDTFEQCIMGRIHRKVFSSYKDTDEDDDLCTRRKALKGICPAKNLDLPFSVYNAESRKMVFEAVRVLDSIGVWLVPDEKISCIVRCCRIIREYFRTSLSKIAGADELLPTLIFVILQTNCWDWYSNINYIRRFRVKDKLEYNEGGYYFQLLCQAAEIIKIGGAKQFLMDPEDFDERLTGRNNHTSMWNISILAAQGFYFFDECKQQLPGLIETSEKISDELYDLNVDLDKLKARFQNRVASIMEHTPPIKLERKTLPHIAAKTDETLQETSVCTTTSKPRLFMPVRKQKKNRKTMRKKQ